ncbi:cation/H(+) antiporter 4-like [Corylus avellana]|uniref:cation/H(+) antiporter 4-like n=1 Tax=Corylus avellana TaxID=13451 RepID=UPI00286A6425|nr:cation/H(+) antiporter 4-like [Corylus avellana]
MVKRTGRKALFTGVPCMWSPMLIGLFVQMKLIRLWLKEEKAYILPYLTIGNCVTPFPVLACLLEDLKILNSELGRLALSAALVSDSLSTMAVVSSSLIRVKKRARPIKDMYIHITMLMVLGWAYLSYLFGLTSLYGPFILGLAVPVGPPLGSTIINKFNCLISDVFMPLLVTTCGMRIDLISIKFDSSFVTVNGILIILTFVAKMGACLIPTLYSKMPLNDALALSLLLSCKGVVQLVYYTLLKDNEHSSLLVKFLYDPSRKYAGYQKRDIMHCRLNAKLKVLVCIHKQDDIAANVILAFNHFEKVNQGVVLVNIFTTISQLKYMHEDICILGLDKLTSLIVLPFHRKWSIEGVVKSNDNTIRSLNCSVLEQAPCSVGILVDHGHFGRSMISPDSSYSVAMIFLGDNDDREALIFAKRMANHSKITMTVVHFVAASNEGDTHCDKLFDNEILNDVKLTNLGNEYVICLEKIVKDGPQTALIVRSMVNEYDLIIVGRRHNVKSPHTSRLVEWSEFSELGIMGDLLASSDLNSGISVLVVQQQQKKT